MRWIEIFRNASPQMRRKLRELILDSVKYYGAKWKKKSDGNYEIASMDKDSKRLINEIKSTKFVGFVTSVVYMKEKGPQNHLMAEWEHPFGTPNLLYKHPKYPMYLIIGPGLRLNDSVLSEIDANNYSIDTIGITG